MKNKAQQFILVSLAFISMVSLEVPKKAFRHYEKGDIKKAIQTLDKSIEKDGLNPGAYYLYSLIHTDPHYAKGNVDEAYQFVLKAISQFKTIKEPKELKSLADVGVDSVSLEKHKDKIDSLKFLDIKSIHTIAAYNEFVQTHAGAKEVSTAIDLRNQIAFSDAQKANTWEKYEQFMKEYPEAKEYPQADSLYKLLIFADKTADGKLNSYKTFLEDFPATPYRDSLVSEIFKISTASNRIEDYEAFLKEYPSEEYQEVAYKRIYHVFKEKYGSADFLRFFPSAKLADSIKNVQQLEQGFWIPKLTDGTIEFVDSNGSPKLKTQFTSVSEDCLCQPTTTDFVSGGTDKGNSVIARNGHVLYEGLFDKATDAGYGFIILESEDGERLIHKSGKRVITEAKEEIVVLNESFIRTKVNGLYGLESIEGLKYLKNEFIEIDTFSQYIWLQKEIGIALVSPKVLYSALDGQSVPLDYSYSEVEILDNGRIWVSRNGEEAILDEELRTVIPFGTHTIYEEPFGWRMKSRDGIRVLHDKYPETKSKVYSNAKSSQQWLALKEGGKWTLLDQLGSLPASEGIDSLSLLGENMVLIYSGNKRIAQFKNGKQVTIEKDWNYKLLVPQVYIKTGKPAIHDYFMLSNSKDFRKIYNEFGREILSATFNDVVALEPNMIRLQKRNAALADSTGHYLLNFVYDGIGSNEGGYVSTLDKGKFGVINPAKKINIVPEYEKLLEPYSDTLLVAVKGRYKGFINSKNKVLTAFEFDEVKYFNDSIALVRIDDEWMLENIRNEEILYERIVDYKIIDVGKEDKTLFITTQSGQGIYSETLGQIIEPTYTFIKILGTQKDPVYFAVKLVAEANIYVVIYYDKKGNKLFTQSFRQEEYFKIACPAN